MIDTPTSPVVEDARALYLAFGGRQHRRIEEAMRPKGYPHFRRRFFYDRFDRGPLRLGGVRRYQWHVVDRSQPPALAGGMTRVRNPQIKRTADSRRTAETIVRT